MQGLIFGWAYIRRGLSTEGNLRFKIDWASLSFQLEGNLPFLLCFSLYFKGNFQVQAPPGGGGGLIHGGAYFRNFSAEWVIFLPQLWERVKVRDSMLQYT